MSHTSDLKLATLRYSIATALFLAALKLTVGWWTASLSVLASAVDSLADIAMSAINYFSMRFAMTPEDEDHPYGHGKAESLAALFVSLLTGVSAGYLIFEGIHRLIMPHPVGHIPAGVFVMIVSIIVTGFQVRRLKRASRSGDSMLMDAEALHYTSDFLTNGGVLLALIVIRWTGLLIFDPLISLALAGYLLYCAVGICRGAIGELMDQNLPEPERRNIDQLILNHHPSITHYHEFRARRAGDRLFIEFHLEIQGKESFEEAHRVTESLVERLHERYPGSVVTIHPDPADAMETHAPAPPKV